MEEEREGIEKDEKRMEKGREEDGEMKSKRLRKVDERIVKDKSGPSNQFPPIPLLTIFRHSFESLLLSPFSSLEMCAVAGRV